MTGKLCLLIASAAPNCRENIPWRMTENYTRQTHVQQPIGTFLFHFFGYAFSSRF
jgi:hypothetical protein